MAKKATGKPGSRSGTKKPAKASAVAVRKPSTGGSRAKESAGDAFIKLLQSPLVAELVAIAATAALASLAEHGFASGGEGRRGKRAGKAVKEAGKAAAAAVGRRLGTELEEIRKSAKGAAKA